MGAKGQRLIRLADWKPARPLFLSAQRVSKSAAQNISTWDNGELVPCSTRGISIWRSFSGRTAAGPLERSSERLRRHNRFPLSQ